MLFKSMLIALLGLFMSGCVAYGGSGHGYRGHDRHYSTTYYQVPRQTLYVVPHYYRHDKHRYEVRRYDVRRYEGDWQAPQRYKSAPAPHHYQPYPHPQRHIQRQAGWDERRHERPRQYHQDDRRQHRQDRQRSGDWQRRAERSEREWRQN